MPSPRCESAHKIAHPHAHTHAHPYAHPHTHKHTPTHLVGFNRRSSRLSSFEGAVAHALGDAFAAVVWVQLVEAELAVGE